MVQKYTQTILSELEAVLKDVNAEDSEQVVKMICGSPRIFLAGAGRSGYMMRAFAMRLMHAGLTAYMVGDTETPSAAAGDLLVLGSGSGETESLITAARKAKKLGMRLLVITGFPDSPLGKLAEQAVRIPAPTPKSGSRGGFVSAQPMGSLFEQALLLYLDAAVMEIMDRKKLDEKIMFGRHANLE